MFRCSNNPTKSPPEKKPPAKSGVALWSTPKHPLPEAKAFSEYPWLQKLSSWSSAGCGEDQPYQPRFMGDFGVGNGHTFALTGYGCPLNSLHSMVGPTYQKYDTFFPDTWIEASEGDHSKKLQVKAGYVHRVKQTPIVMTQERFTGWVMLTLTFAPRRSSEEDPLHRSMLRIIVVKHLEGPAISNIKLKIVNAENVIKTKRTGRWLSPTSQKPDDEALLIKELKPKQEVVAVYAYVLSRTDEEKSKTLEALQKAKPFSLLKDTHAYWVKRLSRAAQLQTPDPRVNDLYEGMLVTTAVQQAYLGGVSPMSHYTRIWTRDCAGPVRFWSRIGWLEDVHKLLSYYHHAAAKSGGIRNSYALDIPLEPKPKEPDWSKLEPLEKRSAAEGPSYVPLMFLWYLRASGDEAFIKARYPMLKYALTGQSISKEGRLPFSGDETYRTAMAMTLGWPLDFDFVGCCDSANSSFLFVAAAEQLADIAQKIGHKEDVNWFREKAKLVRTSTERDFWLKDKKFYRPFLMRKEPAKVYLPYEDVSTKPIWSGYHSPKVGQALEHIKTLDKLLGTLGPVWQSPLSKKHHNYLNQGVTKGIYTGMKLGYVLYNFASMEHNAAKDAFNQLGKAASPSGNYGEYLILDDFSALQIIYDKKGGKVGDYTARYRPWEGAINIDAMVFYLTGFQPDAPNKAMSLAPRLPNGWPEMTWKGLRVGKQLFELKVSDNGTQRTLTVSLQEGSSLDLRLAMSLPDVRVEKVTVNGTVVSQDVYRIWKPFARARLELPQQILSKGKPVQVIVTYKPNTKK